MADCFWTDMVNCDESGCNPIVEGLCLFYFASEYEPYRLFGAPPDKYCECIVGDHLDPCHWHSWDPQPDFVVNITSAVITEVRARFSNSSTLCDWVIRNACGVEQPTSYFAGNETLLLPAAEVVFIPGVIHDSTITGLAIPMSLIAEWKPREIIVEALFPAYTGFAGVLECTLDTSAGPASALHVISFCM